MVVFSRLFFGGEYWWGEATDEPPPLRFGTPSPAREDQPSPGYGATGARPYPADGPRLVFNCKESTA